MNHSTSALGGLNEQQSLGKITPQTDFANRRAVLIAYLQDKVREGDWHGVSDAANDLRVLEAKGF